MRRSAAVPALALAWLLLQAGALAGLDPEKRITQYTVNVWKRERGLPNNSIMAIAQDPSGFLWLGTAEGLVRFDGANFDIFHSGNTPAFRDNLINNLFLDRRGVLWVGTLRGKLLSLEPGGFRGHPLAPEVSRISLSCIAEDGGGDLWVGTSAGVFRRSGDGGPWVRDSGLAAAPVLGLAVDSGGRLLASVAGGGLLRRDGGQWRPILPAAGRKGGDIYAIRPGRDGGLWLGSEDGLARLRDGTWENVAPPGGIHALVTSLLEDRDGNLWVGSESGLYRWRSGDWQAIGKNRGLESDWVYALCEDAEGSLWVGALDGGLAQVRDEKITSFTDREGLAGNKFRCLHGDEDGTLWLGGSGGVLNRIRGGRCDGLRLPGAGRDHVVYALEADGSGALWLGTSRGLLRLHRGRIERQRLPGAWNEVEVRCLARDRQGRLWIGTWGKGVCCRSGGRFTAYSAADGLPGNFVSALHVDSGGGVWAGCENGMAVMAPGPGTRFVVEPFLAGCHVTSFFGDGGGRLWIGTHQGIKVRRQDRWGSLSVEQGLFDSRVYAILADGLGHLWLSSERGLFRVPAREMEAAAFGRSLGVSGRLFDENDGMASRICNYGDPAGWRDPEGRLWFANLTGAASVAPARIRRNERMPPVIIEAALADGRSLPLPGDGAADRFILPAGGRKLEFTYTALSLVRADRIVFRYKLDGYDRDWVDAGGRRQAFYNDLRPGRYRFRVIAANADGVWNRAGASFAFVLRPFVYQTWWFLLLGALAFAALSALSWQLLRRYLRAVSFWKKKTQVGHYKILETIGSGGMATVYKALDLRNPRRVVALKLLKEEYFQDEAQKRRFRHESQITAGLDHPHIVSVYERGESDDCFYIAMELLPGVSLARLIRERGRLRAPDAVAVLRQVVAALKAIHACEILHRDLKPENIMVLEEGRGRWRIKLLDFGLAITPAQSRLTMSGVVMGTVRYLPPERIHGGTSSAAGDIYSAGIILYEMLTAAKPFWSEATGEVIHRILETYPAPAREISPDVPPELEALIAAMIDKDQAKRPSLAEIEAELDKLYPMPGGR